MTLVLILSINTKPQKPSHTIQSYQLNSEATEQLFVSHFQSPVAPFTDMV